MPAMASVRARKQTDHHRGKHVFTDDMQVASEGEKPAFQAFGVTRMIRSPPCQGNVAWASSHRVIQGNSSTCSVPEPERTSWWTEPVM